MTYDELRRIALFVQAVNRAELDHRVSLNLKGSYDDKYIELTPSRDSWLDLEIEPRIGGSSLTLVRRELKS